MKLFIGTSGYNYRDWKGRFYPKKQLEAWAKKIRTHLKRYDVYCYFNNDVGGFATTNAKELSKLVGEN